MSTNILKKNAAFFAKYICDDINTSIRSSKFQNELKEVDIVPVHKKKSKVSTENSRPTTILPNISKIYKRCTYDQISSFFEDVFSKSQWGFRKGLRYTALPVSYGRKMEKNSGLWRCLLCIIYILV